MVHADFPAFGDDRLPAGGALRLQSGLRLDALAVKQSVLHAPISRAVTRRTNVVSGLAQF
jgi:hypothetical protein